MDDKSYTIRVPKRWVRVALIVGVTALIVAPLTAIATHSFTDVPNDNTFHADIEAIANVGVTQGCNPPANTLYCPKDLVTREQMAAFMNRLGALGPDQTPVANAATAIEAEGVSQVRRVVDQSTALNLPDGNSRSHTATCPAGFVAMGGGGFSSHQRVLLEDSRPTPAGTAWQVLYRNMQGDTANNYRVTVYVTCIQADETVLADASMQGLDTVGDKLD
jgi:hypothetical protein